MSIWYSRRKKEEKSLRLAAAGKSAFCFAELHYDARSLAHAAGVAAERALRLYRKIDRKKIRKQPKKAERKPLSAFFERILSKN